MANEPEYKLTKFKIINVQEGASGTKGKRKWQIVKFTTDHVKAVKENGEPIEFTKFVDPDKPKDWPIAGAEVDEMTFDMAINGDFTNYTAKKITYAFPGKFPTPKQVGTQATAQYTKPVTESQNTTPPVKPRNGKDNPIWMIMKYFTELQVKCLEQDTTITYSEAANMIVSATIEAYDRVSERLSTQ